MLNMESTFKRPRSFMDNKTIEQVIQTAINIPEARHERKITIQNGKILLIEEKRILLTKN